MLGRAVVELVGECPHEAGRGAHVVVRMPRERVVQPPAAGVGGLGEQLATGRGEPDQAGAAVGRIGPADHEPARLQLTDLPADDGLADAAPGRQLTEPQLTLAEQESQLEGGEGAGHGVADRVPVGTDECDDGVAERVRGVLRGSALLN